MKDRYEEAGVNIDLGNALVKAVYIPAIKSTARPGFPWGQDWQAVRIEGQREFDEVLAVVRAI